MKPEKLEWRHHVYVDGVLKEDLDYKPNLNFIGEKYSAIIMYQSPLQNQPITVYKFKSVPPEQLRTARR